MRGEALSLVHTKSLVKGVMFHVPQQPGGLREPSLFPSLSGRGREAGTGPRTPLSAQAMAGPTEGAISGAPT